MRLREGTWGELEFGMYLSDPAGKPWSVKDKRDGWVLLVDAVGAEMPVPPTDPRWPVRIWEMEEAEVIDLLSQTMGATMLMVMESLGTQDARAQRVTVAVPRTADDMRMHLNLMHGEMIDKATAKDLPDLTAWHEQLHVDASSRPMRFAHHHDPNFR